MICQRYPPTADGRDGCAKVYAANGACGVTDQDDGWADRAKDEVAYVCRQLERIRAVLQAHGSGGAAPLERLVTALRAGEDHAAPRDVLHEALLAAGDAAGIRSQARDLNPIGVGPAMPEEWVLLCPTDQCSHYSWPSHSDVPRCRISDRPLRRRRL
jgi:hypothetical protein